MFSRKFKFAAAAAAIALTSTVAAISAPAVAQDRRVVIINNTGFTMVNFYASNSSRTSWEEDILGSDVLRSGQRVRINIDDGTGACLFDFKAVFSDGDELIRQGINVCQITTYTYN